MRNIVARFSLFFVIIMMIPGLMAGYFAYESYLDFSKPFLKEEGGSYKVWTGYQWMSFSKEIIDGSDEELIEDSYLKQLNETRREIYYGALEIARHYSEMKKRDFYLFGILFLLCSGAVALFWFKNKIALRDDEVVFTKLSLFKFKKETFNIHNIDGIGVVTTTPLIPERTDINQINWREKIEVYYHLPSGAKVWLVVPLFIFPGFRKIVEEILKRRPEIKVGFKKHTIIDNLQSL